MDWHGNIFLLLLLLLTFSSVETVSEACKNIIAFLDSCLTVIGPEIGSGRISLSIFNGKGLIIYTNRIAYPWCSDFGETAV